MMNLPGVEPETYRDDVGRPTDYRPEYDSRALKLCENGATDADLADEFGVSERTINRWRVRNESFAIATRIGKEHADELVKQSFFKIARGYEYEETFFDKNGVERVRTVVVPPNVTAVTKWLSARTPEFRETQRVEHSGEVKQGVDVTAMNPVQRQAYRVFLETMSENREPSD